MAQPAFQLVEVEPVEEKAITIVDQAKAVKVTDTETYVAAGSLWKAIGDMIKEVKDTFDPICDAAHKTHKQAVEKRSKYLDPLTLAQKSVKQLMSAYDQQQEALRQAEQRRLEAIARKVEEDRLLAEAILIEEDAKRNGATKEEAQQESAAIMAEPVYIAPVIIPKAIPKMAGGPVYRSITKFEVVNAALIPAIYMVPDMVKIGGVVRALKMQANIPGIRIYEERC